MERTDLNIFKLCDRFDRTLHCHCRKPFNPRFWTFSKCSTKALNWSALGRRQWAHPHRSGSTAFLSCCHHSIFWPGFVQNVLGRNSGAVYLYTLDLDCTAFFVDFKWLEANLIHKQNQKAPSKNAPLYCYHWYLESISWASVLRHCKGHVTWCNAPLPGPPSRI